MRRMVLLRVLACLIVSTKKALARATAVSVVPHCTQCKDKYSSQLVSIPLIKEQSLFLTPIPLLV